MTTDFAEDFIEACDKEDEPYLIVYRSSEGGLVVRWCLDNYEVADPKITTSKEQDIIDAVEFCLKEK